jgi:hypothetical protein
MTPHMPSIAQVAQLMAGDLEAASRRGRRPAELFTEMGYRFKDRTSTRCCTLHDLIDKVTMTDAGRPPDRRRR